MTKSKGKIPYKKKAPLWTPQENRFLFNSAGRLTATQVSEYLGRTEAAIKVRCSRLGISLLTEISSNLRGSNSPFSVGRRTLLAKTCSTCGKLLPASRFYKRVATSINPGYWDSRCKTCKHGSDTNNGISASNPKWMKDQEYSKSLAFRSGLPWSSEEKAIVEDTSKSVLEIALSTGRTLKAVSTKSSELGIYRRRSPDDFKKWVVLLDKDNVEKALEMEHAGLLDREGIPTESEWEWSD